MLCKRSAGNTPSSARSLGSPSEKESTALQHLPAEICREHIKARSAAASREEPMLTSTILNRVVSVCPALRLRFGQSVWTCRSWGKGFCLPLAVIGFLMEIGSHNPARAQTFRGANTTTLRAICSDQSGTGESSGMNPNSNINPRNPSSICPQVLSGALVAGAGANSPAQIQVEKVREQSILGGCPRKYPPDSSISRCPGEAVRR